MENASGVLKFLSNSKVTLNESSPCPEFDGEAGCFSHKAFFESLPKKGMFMKLQKDNFFPSKEKFS